MQLILPVLMACATSRAEPPEATIPDDQLVELARATGIVESTVHHADADYTVVDVDLAAADFDLRGGHGFDINGANRWAADRGGKLVFATNAGMFREDRSACGLFVTGGESQGELNRAKKPTDGPVDNFRWTPNGVFWIDAAGAHVTETEAYAALNPPGVRIASQSGPMVLVGGAVHDGFDTSRSFNIRSGVCAAVPGTARFVISRAGVRFEDFATVFRDALGCSDALYLDGAISVMHTPSAPIERSQSFGGMFVAAAK